MIQRNVEVIKHSKKDFSFNIIRLVMDRSRLYAFLKKITPMYWYTRPFTRFVLERYGKNELIGVEIGVDYGLNAKTMLTFLPIKKLYLIDPYSEEVDGISGDKRFVKAQQFLAKFDKKIEFIRKTSEGAITHILDNLDFVYIDGAHDYEHVKKDIELYYPKVETGGIIGGHDFWASKIDVCKAVLEFAATNNIQIHGELTDWWVVK
jgi:hypothetical protein